MIENGLHISSPAITRLGISFAYAEFTATQRYRCVHPAEQGALYRCECRLLSIPDPAISERIRGADALVLHRLSLDRRVKRLIANAKKQGSIVLFDTDDLLFEPDLLDWLRSTNGSSLPERAFSRRVMRGYAETLALSDGCIVSTDYLAQRAIALGHRAWVLRNAFSLEMVSLSEAAMRQGLGHEGNVVIGYASGSATHQRDFEEAESALQQVLREQPSAQFWVLGYLQLSASWKAFGARVRRIPAVPWRQLPGVLAQFDVNIAPLELGNPFCEAKSEIKWMEAALVGVPTIASPTEAFKHAIEPGKTGLLAASPADWHKHLTGLVRSEALRREIGSRAREAALAHYHPLVRGRELIRILNEVGEAVHGRPLCEDREVVPVAQPQMPIDIDSERLEERASLLYRAVYSLWNRGISFLLLQVLAFLARRVPWRRRTDDGPQIERSSRG